MGHGVGVFIFQDHLYLLLCVSHCLIEHHCRYECQCECQYQDTCCREVVFQFTECYRSIPIAHFCIAIVLLLCCAMLCCGKLTSDTFSVLFHLPRIQSSFISPCCSSTLSALFPLPPYKPHHPSQRLRVLAPALLRP
jgi:hypothetical protein